MQINDRNRNRKKHNSFVWSLFSVYKCLNRELISMMKITFCKGYCPFYPATLINICPIRFRTHPPSILQDNCGRNVIKVNQNFAKNATLLTEHITTHPPSLGHIPIDRFQCFNFARVYFSALFQRQKTQYSCLEKLVLAV